MDKSNISLIRFTVTTVIGKYILGKSMTNQRYLILKTAETKSLKAGDDVSHYAELVKCSLFFQVYRFLTKDEESELYSANPNKTLKEMGIKLDCILKENS